MDVQVPSLFSRPSILHISELSSIETCCDTAVGTDYEITRHNERIIVNNHRFWGGGGKSAIYLKDKRNSFVWRQDTCEYINICFKNVGKCEEK